MNNTNLINPITNEHAWKEPVYDDFVIRDEFINRTGIFISPMAYDYIYDIEFKESGLTPDEFISMYEAKHVGEIGELELKGTFKYLVTDDEVSCLGDFDDCHEPTIHEIVNSLSRTCTEVNQKWYEKISKTVNLCEQMKDDYERVLLELHDLQSKMIEKDN